MSHYCGIDLHSNNHVVVVIDDAQGLVALPGYLARCRG